MGPNGGKPLSVPRWYFLVAVVVSVLLLALTGVVYTNYAIKQQNKAERTNDRRWCQLLTTLDDAYQASPPQSAAGKQLAADVHRLRADLGCP